MRLVAVGLVVLTVAACGPPINVRRASPRAVTADLTRSALNGSTRSVPTQNSLYRWNLTERFEKDPEGAIAALHDIVVTGKGGPGSVFALAELCFAHADATHKREYYLASAVYAYAFLFPHGADRRAPSIRARASLPISTTGGSRRPSRPRTALASISGPASTRSPSVSSRSPWTRRACAGGTRPSTTSSPWRS
jgi:hypothetical protein